MTALVYATLHTGVTPVNMLLIRNPVILVATPRSAVPHTLPPQVKYGGHGIPVTAAQVPFLPLVQVLPVYTRSLAHPESACIGEKSRPGVSHLYFGLVPNRLILSNLISVPDRSKSARDGEAGPALP